MNKPQLELADVVRHFAGPYEAQFGHLMLPSHRRALQDIAKCMTEAMGGGRYDCNDCHDTFWSYHGCRNRSCPKCHGRQIADWLKNHPESSGRLIERALIMTYDLKEPKMKGGK